MGRKSIAHIRRKEIIEGFFKVVAEKGIANASIREITEAAGVSKGVLHHYFVNKKEMVLGVMDHVLDTYMSEMLEGLERIESATAKMEFVLAWFLDLGRFGMEFSRAWMEFWILSKTDEDIAKALRNCYGQITDLLRSIIQQGIDTEEFAKVDPAVTANMIVASLEGTTMLWVVSPEATPVRAMNDEIAKMYLDYVSLKNEI
jgi:AcrR family transcriptional regulator